MTAPIAFSESSIAPSTDSSASRFCGGTSAVGSACAVLTRQHQSRRAEPRPDGTRPAEDPRARSRENGTHVPMLSPTPDTVVHRSARNCSSARARSLRSFRALVHSPRRAALWEVWTTLWGTREGPHAGPSRHSFSASTGTVASSSSSGPPRAAGSSSVSASSVALSASACAVRRGLGLGPLGRLERRELLLGRQLAALGHDERLHLGGDALEDVDRDRVAADPLDHVQVDLAPVDADLPRPPELLGDVGRRHRAEQRAGRAGLHLEAQHGLRQRLGDLAGLLGRPRLVPRPLRSMRRSSATRPAVATSASRRGSR